MEQILKCIPSWVCIFCLHLCRRNGAVKNLHKMNKIKFSIKRSGAFYGKIQVVAHRNGLGLFVFNPEFDGYDVNHKLCVSKIQVFLFWFILEIDLPFVDQGSNERYQIYHPKDMRKTYP